MSQLDKINSKINEIVSKVEEVEPPVEKVEEITKEQQKVQERSSPTDTFVNMIINRMPYATEEQKHRASQVIMHLMAKVSSNPQVFGMFTDKTNIAQTARIVTQIVNLDLPFAGQDMYYIIPYKNQLSLQLSFYGLLEIAYRSGGVFNVQCNVVYSGDDFDYYYSNTNYFKHKHTGKSQVPTHYYATAKVVVQGSQTPPELILVVMTEEEMQAFKKKYSRNNPLWNSDYISMAKKTLVKQLLKLCPKRPVSTELLGDEGSEDEK